jgi:hypothetical protein
MRGGERKTEHKNTGAKHHVVQRSGNASIADDPFNHLKDLYESPNFIMKPNLEETLIAPYRSDPSWVASSLLATCEYH